MDLLAFANNPEAALGAFEVLPLKNMVHVEDQAFTPRWRVTRTRYVHSSVSTDYSWQKRKGNTLPIEHTLVVASDVSGSIHRFVLGCATAVDLVYEISYEVSRDQAQAIMFAQRSMVSAGSDNWQILREFPLPFEEVLRFIPARMIQSFQRAELASV